MKTTNKKIFGVFLLVFALSSILLFSVVSSTPINSEFDSITYSNNDMKVDFMKDGVSEGSMLLKSHKSVEEILKVGLGLQVPMFYEFDFKKKFDGVLESPVFIDQKNGEIINRDYSFVYWGETITQREVCDVDVLGNNETNITTTYICNDEDYSYFSWLDYDTNNIPLGKIIIGIQTFIEIDDKIDGVWSISNKKITKHAVWTADLNTNLFFYAKADDNLVTTNVIDSVSSNDLTSSVNTNTISTTGIINTAFNLNGVDEYISGSFSKTFDDAISYSFWLQYDDYAIPTIQVILEGDTDTEGLVFIDATNGLHFALGSGGDATFANTITDTNLHYYVVTYDGINVRLYKDGSEFGTSPVAKTYGAVTFTSFNIGSRGSGTSYFLDGIIDEVGIWDRVLTSTEVIQIWNGGSGITLIIDTPPIITTLTETSLTYNSVTLNGNLTDLGTENGGNVFFQYIKTSDI